MKQIILIVALMLPAILNFAQEDVVRVDSSKEEVNLELELEDLQQLENGVSEFEKSISELNAQIETLELEAVTEGVSAEREAELEAEITEAEKQIAAFEKGIENLEKELAEKEHESIDSDEDFDFDFDWDKLHDFDSWPFKKKKKKFNGHWAGFELGLTNFVDANNELELPLGGEYMELDPVKSWSLAFNFLEFNIPLHKNYIGLVSGVGFEGKFYNLETNGNLAYDIDGNTTFDVVDYKIRKNKLNTSSFTMPLLLEFQIPMGVKDRRINISAGVIGSIRVGSNTEQSWEDDNSKKLLLTRSDFNLSTFKYGYTVRIGYRGFQLYANYEVTPLFEAGTGPELYPVSVGIRVLNF